MTTGEHGRTNDGHAAAVAEHWIMVEKDDWLLLRDRKFLCHGTFECFSQQDGSPGRLAAHWSIRTVQSYSGIELQLEVQCVGLTHKWQSWAL